MQLINLRQRPAAIALIAPWHFAEWGALFPDRSLADFAAELALCLSNDVLPQTWLLQDAAGEIVGTGSLLLQDMATNQQLSPWLANIYLVPEVRGQGLGRCLVQQLMQQAAQLQAAAQDAFGLPRMRRALGVVHQELRRAHHGRQRAAQVMPQCAEEDIARHDCHCIP